MPKYHDCPTASRHCLKSPLLSQLERLDSWESLPSSKTIGFKKRKKIFPTVCHKSLTCARNTAYGSASHTYKRGDIHLSPETLEMYLDLFLSALMVLFMILNPAERILYFASMLGVKLFPDVKSRRNPPIAPVLVRSLGLPGRLLQTFQLTYFFCSLGVVLAFFCSLLAAYLGKSLWGLSGSFLQLLAMGTFSDCGKVSACDQKILLLCSVVKCLAFLKCFRQWGSTYFSNFKKSPPLWWHFFIFSISHMESSLVLLLTHTTCRDGAFMPLQNASLLDSEHESRFHLLCISSPIKILY